MADIHHLGFFENLSEIVTTVSGVAAATPDAQYVQTPSNLQTRTMYGDQFVGEGARPKTPAPPVLK